MRKLIGYVGVDSGQILICDPCYIDSQWKKEEFTDVREYKHTDGTILKYPKDFSNYEKVIKKYNKTMDQLLENKEVTELPAENKAENNFSYNACCKTTLGHPPFGQLFYEAGHPGVGVVSESGDGDGMYSVYAEIDHDDRVQSITIEFR